MRENRDDLQGFYICGRCKTKIFYLLNEGKKSAIPCPDCGWEGGEKDYKNIPYPIKLDLTQY